MRKFPFCGGSFARRLVFLTVACALVSALGIIASGKTRARQNGPMWEQVAEKSIASRGTRRIFPEKYLTYRLDLNQLQQVLDRAPMENSDEARRKVTVISIPMPNGQLQAFQLEESPLLSPEIAAQHPTWKTYQGFGIDDRSAYARFDLTDSGFHGYVLSSEGTFSIDPYQVNDRDNYLVFAKSDMGRTSRYHCEVEEMLDTKSRVHDSPIDFAPAFTHGAQLRTYRLAIGTTAEYTNIFRQAGDTDAQAQTRAFNQVVITANRVSGVYRKELAVAFMLVSNTSTVYAVSPETPADYSNSGSPDLNANVTNLNAAYGSTGYDIGHVFGSSDNGVAQLSSVCGSSKARGYSGQPNPVGDPFDVDYVAHEMGHQFGANHTFSAQPNCNSSPAVARREPGSAVTIMGYAGICSGGSNPQRNSIDIFHNYSQTEALNFLGGTGGTCGTLIGTNTVPVVAALQNYTIPFNTPFELNATATDADGDALTYGWEQSDPAASAASYPGTTDDDDVSRVFRPGFRSYLPKTNGSRMFPSLTYVLNNSNEAPVFYTGTSAVGMNCGNSPGGQCITGEDLPSEARTMNFKVTVRDGKGGIADGTVILTVINTTTPFKVTSQNASPATWNGGSTQNITWDVSGTNAGSINAANVKISLSVDGGQTFGHVLAASTPNTGSASVTVPSVDTTTARIKIEAIGNVFFDINDANFTITSAPASSGSVGGRIVSSTGAGIPRTTVRMTGPGGVNLAAITNAFGYYRFDGVAFNVAYTLTPVAKGYTFSPVSSTITPTADALNNNFTGTR